MGQSASSHGFETRRLIDKVTGPWTRRCSAANAAPPWTPKYLSPVTC